MYPNGYSSGQKNKAQNSPNFSGPRLPHQTFEEFQKFAKETDFLNNLRNIFTDKNLLGKGVTAKVYNIPNNDTFLVKIPKDRNEATTKLQIIKATDPFLQNNLGQVIANIGDNFTQILIKQSGEPNGIKDWLTVFKKSTFPKAYLPEFIEKLKTVEGMEQKAYNTLAEEICLLNASDYYFDHINPQNILLDKDAQLFNIIDIGKGTKIDYCNINGFMKFSLMDERNFHKALNASDKTQKNEIVLLKDQIKAKIKTATNNL